MAQFLECVTAAAQIGLRELARLLETEKRHADIRVTLQVTPRAALGLLQQLIAEGFVREATGRASWQAFVLLGYYVPRNLSYAFEAVAGNPIVDGFATS
jgi:hypothetical protein